MGLLEAVARRDERTGLVVHALAKLVGGDIEIVVNERGRTGFGLGVEKVRIFLDPVIEDGEVLAHDALIALEHHVAVAQGDGRDRIVEHAAAN